MILLFSVTAVASVVSLGYAVKCMIENDPSLLFALISGAVTGIIAAFLLIVLIRDHKRFKDAREASSLSNIIMGIGVNDTGLQIYITPEALIGFNRGLTVVDREDIVSIKAKKLHHSQRVGLPHPYTVGNPGLSLIHALLDDYREWNTYFIIIKTRTHKRMVLSETGDSRCDKTLTELLNKDQTGFSS